MNMHIEAIILTHFISAERVSESGISGLYGISSFVFFF